MRVNKALAVTVLAVVMAGSLTGCSNMSKRDRNTAIGAGVGAVSGSVLTGGSTLGTLGGAALGGVIGHEVKR
ncbi:osmotically-inducible lipoprotein OsmB [Lonsdalea quercina]|uniref:osmotically-inducible lipoprotein OsmB n=1 Tax=Lonsdalea quercina TaxID=71657 RepID=UPI003974FCC7